MIRCFNKKNSRLPHEAKDPEAGSTPQATANHDDTQGATNKMTAQQPQHQQGDNPGPSMKKYAAQGRREMQTKICEDILKVKQHL